MINVLISVAFFNFFIELTIFKLMFFNTAIFLHSGPFYLQS